MSKYTCNEKLSEKKISKSAKQKMMGMLIAGAVTISALSGVLYAAYRGDIDKSNEVKDYNMPYKISQGSHNEPMFSKFMKENIDDFKILKKDIDRYKELHDIPNRSDKSEKEMEELTDKINNEYGAKIERFSLETAKSKLADVYHISPADIAVRADILEQKISIKNRENGKVLLDPSSQLIMKDALIDLINLQNNTLSNNLDKARHANSLTILFGKTLEMGSKTYKLSRNNELLEIDMQKKTAQPASKIEHDER